MVNKLPSEFYNENVGDRGAYERRAEKLAAITLPYLTVSDSSNSNTEMLYEIAQSFNGMLINNLAAKVGMALLPPRTSSFRFLPDPQALLAVTQGNEDMNAVLQQELSFKQDAINMEIENQQIRSTMFDMARQLIGAGPVILEKIDGKGLQMHTLKSIVVKLNARGEPLTMAFVEKLSVLPEGVTVAEEKKEYELYTMADYDNETDRWVVTQDIDGELVGEEMSYAKEDLPYKYLGWTWMPGEKYHRPFAEDYYSDMEQVNRLARLNTEGAIAAAKILIFVNQRGNRTRKKDIADSKNGDIVDGDAADVTTLQMEKNYDFQVSNQREQDIKRELQKAFLDTGSVTRDAERVTAEEIRVMTQQLESSTLAGIYSKMALHLSKWIVEMVMKELNIKFEAMEVSVLTGLDALGRSAEAQKLDSLVQRAIATNTRHYIRDGELLQRYASYDGVNTVGLLKTPQEVQKEQALQREQMQKDAMITAGAESFGKEGGAQAVKNMNQNQGAQ